MSHQNSIELLQFSVGSTGFSNNYPKSWIVSPLVPPHAFSPLYLILPVTLFIFLCLLLFEFVQVAFSVQQPFNDIRRAFDLYKEYEDARLYNAD